MQKTMNLMSSVIFMIALVSCQGMKDAKTSRAISESEIKSKRKRADIDLSKGLAAEWKLAGNAKDSLGRNNGVALNVIFKKELDFPFGVFNGTNSVIMIKPKKPLITGKHITVSAWIKRTGKSDNPSAAVIVGRSGYHNGWRLMTTDDQRPENVMKNQARLQIGAKRGGGFRSSRTKLEPEKWNHIIGLWNGIQFKVCVNGELGHFGYCASEYLPTKYWLGIGYNARGTGHFNGCIGDVRIWNRMLNDAEVKAVYQQGVAKLTDEKKTVNHH